jgi:hypothetical protein
MWTAHARSYQRRLHDRNLQYNDAVARIAELHKEQIKADGEYCAIDEERVREMRSADEQSQINIDLRHQLNQLVNYTNAAAHAVRDMMWIAFVRVEQRRLQAGTHPQQGTIACRADGYQ